MSTGAIILAAGGSSRLGTPKQLLRMGGEALLDRAVRIAIEAGCAPVIVVLGASEKEVRRQCRLKDTIVVSHSGWSEGMGSSLARGMQEVKGVAGVIVMTCDMPGVTADHLWALRATGVITASSYAGRKGVPAYFPKIVFPELSTMRGDTGARALLQTAPSVELPGGELDIDTIEDLATARGLFA